MFHRQYFRLLFSVVVVLLLNKCDSASYIAKQSEKDIKKIDERNAVLDKLHLGCYKDKENDRDLTEHIWNSETNTVETCMTACREQGYRFAGLQNGKDCFCGNNVHRKHGKGEDCNKHCTGNGGQLCGGEQSNNVYRVPKDPRYLGCYEGNFNTILWNSKKPQPARYCIEACAKENKKYASVRGGDCKCSDELPTQTENEESCSLPCNGHFMENCGGKNADAIYDTELARKFVIPFKKEMVKLFDTTGTVNSIQTSLFVQYPRLRAVYTSKLVIHSEYPARIPLSDPECSNNCYRKCGDIYHPEGIKIGNEEVILRFFFFDMKQLSNYVSANTTRVYIYAQTVLLDQNLELKYALHIKTRQLFINLANSKYIHIDKNAPSLEYDMNNYKIHGPNQDNLHARQSWMCANMLFEENPKSNQAYSIIDFISNSYSDQEESKDLFGTFRSQKIQLIGLLRKNIRPVPFYSKQFFLHLLDNYYDKISIYKDYFDVILDEKTDIKDFIEKVEQMIRIHTEANIEDADLALTAAINAIESSNATYWKLREQFDISKRQAIFYGGAFRNNSINATDGKIEEALEKFIEAIETVVEGIEDFDYDDLEDSLTYLLDGFIGLAETLKNLLDTIRTVIHLFRVSDQLIKDLDSATNATRLETYADIIERSSQLQIGVTRWKLLKNAAVTLLSHERVNFIPAATEYRDALIVVTNWGEALTRAMVEKAELLRNALEKKFNLENKMLEKQKYEEFLRLLIANYGNRDKVLKAMAEQTYEVRLDLNAILIQFCRAYFYENLQACKSSSRPHFGESLSNLLLRVNAARRDGLFLPNPPSTINRVLNLVDKPGNCEEMEDCPIKSLKENRGFQLVIDTNRPELQDLNKFRVAELEVKINGAKPKGDKNILKILIQCSGLYKGKNRGNLYNFLTRPISLSYEYNLVTNFVSIKADIYKPFRNIINHVTPYTTWYIRVSPDRSSEIDLSEVSSVDFRFKGYASPDLIKSLPSKNQ